MIYQIHYQSIEDLDRTDLVAQGEPPEGLETSKFLQDWLKDVVDRHPIPEGYQWMICNEKSEYFVLAPLEKK